MLHKLQSGLPVTVSVTGGSVTADHQRHCDRDPNAISYHHDASWSRLVFSWINATWPNPNHVFVKGAVPATGSAYFALCGDQHMPQQARAGAAVRRANLVAADDVASLPASPPHSGGPSAARARHERRRDSDAAHESGAVCSARAHAQQAVAVGDRVRGGGG